MYTYGERIRWAMAQTKPPTSGRALARRIGIQPQSIHYLCSPGSNAQGSRHTPAIARALGVSPEWLATGQGSPYKRNGRHQVDHREAVANCLRTAQQLLVELERLARALDEKG
ncbi:hypothetical protein HTY52_12985 [Cupriavidus taiwanensis]|uniref:hypothetical protein n=1 Tax=Cupriavidus taiwanensis TaxID=164546 RepID=UPI001572A9DD|nr:hypothetical protein [Cupriavidus taiwanensis]NSX14991.1 hypothetical protein [Cupriavidus taiwanensis]